MPLPWRRGWVGQNLAARSPAGGGGGGSSTFNASRKGAAITLSPDLLTANSAANSESVDGTTSHASGVWQVEFLATTLGAFSMIGFGNINHDVTGAAGYPGADTDSVGLVVDTGTLFFGGSSLGQVTNYTPLISAGQRVVAELDMTSSPPTVRFWPQGASAWSDATTLTGFTGPAFYVCHPDNGGEMTVNPVPVGAIAPLGSATAWS